MNEMRLSVKGAKIAKKNFSGRQEEYNERGDRTCLIILGPEQAHQLGYSDVAEMVDELSAMDWKIRRFRAKDDDDSEPDAFMACKIVYYERRQSNIYMKTDRNSVLLNEDTVGKIDMVDVDTVDVIINKHHWEYKGREGFNNEIKSMEVRIIEDEIQARYNDEPEEVPFFN